jgi:hypothetical protein
MPFMQLDRLYELKCLFVFPQANVGIVPGSRPRLICGWLMLGLFDGCFSTVSNGSMTVIDEMEM